MGSPTSLAWAPPQPHRLSPGSPCPPGLPASLPLPILTGARMTSHCTCDGVGLSFAVQQASPSPDEPLASELLLLLHRHLETLSPTWGSHTGSSQSLSRATMRLVSSLGTSRDVDLTLRLSPSECLPNLRSLLSRGHPWAGCLSHAAQSWPGPGASCHSHTPLCLIAGSQPVPHPRPGAPSR